MPYGGLRIAAGESLKLCAALRELGSYHGLAQHGGKIARKLVKSTGQVAHFLYQCLQLLLQRRNFTLVTFSHCQQRLVLLLPTFEVAPGLCHEFFLATVILQKLTLALLVERPLPLLRLPDGIEQLIQVGDLVARTTLLGMAARGQRQTEQDTRQQHHSATHESPPEDCSGRFNNCGAVIFCATRKAWARPRL